VAQRFSRALDGLEKAGVRLSNEKLPLLDDMQRSLAKGGIAAAEAFAVHRDRIGRRGADADPNVHVRIVRGGEISASDYIEMTHERIGLVRAMDARLGDLDALVMPTTPIVAPKLTDVATLETFAACNSLLLRNTAIVNFFDLCAISLPLPRDGGLSVGLMLAARNGQDSRLFRIAAAVESTLIA
jgi:aspartyl-tRNA(Asn)/glutamyl-tRNA(Gln) amidotransferase subunit A